MRDSRLNRAMADIDEEWRPIPGFEGFYDVSSIGQVRSHPRHYPVERKGKTFIQFRKGQLMKLRETRHGYLEVRLRARSRGTANSANLVHKLVLEAFIGPRPAGMQCCHNNGKRTDNRVSNLRWDTPSANMQDCIRHGTQPKMRNTHCPSGHPFDDSNTYRHPRHGARQCRTCGRDRQNAKRGGKARSKTHCRRGHEFTAENTYWNRGRTNRQCRRCHLDAGKARYWKKAA